MTHSFPTRRSSDLAAEFRSRGVVGVDFSGNPTVRLIFARFRHARTGFAREGPLLPSPAPKPNALQVGPFVGFLPAVTRAQELGLPLALHFAEVRDDAESAEILRTQPQRLGHA